MKKKQELAPIFTDQFIQALPEDPDEALTALCNKFIEFEPTTYASVWTDSGRKCLVQAYGVLMGFIELHGEMVHAKLSRVRLRKVPNSQGIVRIFYGLRDDVEQYMAKHQLDTSKEHARVLWGSAFAYEFDKDDLARIQKLINRLRDLISRTPKIEEQHKLRLLKRLERLQLELHKKVSDLDRFWGLVGDASVVLRKVGENAKPVIEVVREILEIIWRTQCHAEQLPLNSQLQLLTDRRHV